MNETITIQNARLHNLKNISLTIPKNKLIVFTGLSGSGKSSLAFDTLHKEGQRQYLESMGFIDHLGQPEVDRIEGLSPSISVDQYLTNRSPRSTVGTATEVYTYLRVLFARIGRRPCPKCGALVPPTYQLNGEPASIAGSLSDEGSEGQLEQSAEEMGESFPCPICGAAIPEIGMAHFSFNKPAGACPACTGLGETHQIRPEQIIDETRSIMDGAVLGWDIHYIKHHITTLTAAAKHYGFTFDPHLPVNQYEPAVRELLYHGSGSPQFKRYYPDILTPDAAQRGNFEGVASNLLRRYAEHIHDTSYREKMAPLMITRTCPDCEGTRLRSESRQVQVNGQNIIDVARLPLEKLGEWLETLTNSATPEEMQVIEPILIELNERVRRLLDVGVGYLTLERASPSLSAGEAQRLRLAALLGSGLTGVLYVLDEPTIGLHARDNQRLMVVLRRLRDLGNTILVVEHDLEVIQAADFVVDFGPGAGRSGGRVVAACAPQELSAHPESLTGAYLSGAKHIPIPPRRTGNGKSLTIIGAGEHNLKNISVRFPLGRLIAVTGVSGSGKSSLMLDILDRAGRVRFYNATDEPGKHDAILGWEYVDKMITIDQAAIGRMPRSNAATYTDVFGAIREVFAGLPAARHQKLTPGHFSFNVPGGRCERCQGAGQLLVKMHLLPDVQVRCPACRGRRFQPRVLEVKYHEASIAQVLEMTVEEALALFAEERSVREKLVMLSDVGLGYLQLGQPATTLSGGEAQRIKLSKELARRATGRTLYLLDEPSTGLHVDDTARLLAVLQRLVEAGNTVIVIEHNLEIIKTCDWVIDLGPEGGAAGGQVMAEGTPEEVTQVEGSITGRYLKKVL